MNQDIESSLSLWVKKYIDETKSAPTLPQKSIFNEVPDEFDRQAVYVACQRNGITTPVRIIIHNWLKMGFMKKIGKNQWQKIKNEK